MKVGVIKMSQVNNIENDKGYRFSIWDLNVLQNTFYKQIQSLNISNNLKDIILDWEQQKIKVCRINLNYNYIPYVIVYPNTNDIFIHHTWNGSIFDIDHFSENLSLLYYQPLEYTLGNIFDLVVSNVIKNKCSLNDTDIQAIIISTQPFARFNYSYFKFLENNFPDKSFVNKISAIILLYDFSFEENNYVKYA